MTDSKTLTIDNDVKRYFDFLVTDFGFIKIKPYGYSRETHFDYIKENLIVKVSYDSGYFVNILKSKKIENDLLTNKTKSVDYDFKFFKRYDLKQLDKKRKIYNSANVQLSKEQELKYNSELLRQNPEILKSDFKKLTLRYLLIRKIKNWL